LHALIISDDHPSDQLLIMLIIKSAISWWLCQLLLPGKCKTLSSLRKFLQNPDRLDSRLQYTFFCETYAAEGGGVEPAGRTCAANVGESELASLCDQGVEGVPNNLPMPD